MQNENRRQRQTRMLGIGIRLVGQQRVIVNSRLPERKILRMKGSKYVRHQGIRECSRRRARLNPFQTEIRSRFLYLPK